MKKFVSLLLVLFVVMSFAACGRRNDTDTNATTESTAAPTTTAPTTAPTTMPVTMPVTMPTIETNIPDPDTNNGTQNTDGLLGTEDTTAGMKTS